MSKNTAATNNYALPGEPMSIQQFENMIRKAEKGPFHTMLEVRAEFEKWKSKYLK